MMRRDLWQKGAALVVTLSLVILLVIVFAPSAPAVKLSPGTPNKYSVTKSTSVLFSYVNLTIRGPEAIPVNYLNFTINDKNSNQMIAYVKFALDGTELDDHYNVFNVIMLTDISTIPFQNNSLYYGYDEEAGKNVTGFGYGYGYGSGSTDLNILYNITYKTQSVGKFYARLFVNSGNHTYASDASGYVNVTDEGSSPPSPPPSPPPDNEPPVANAGGPYTGYVNKSITFSGSQSTDAVGITGYRWDWTADGVYDTNWSAVAITAHSYPAEGAYTLRLEVKNAENLTDSDTATVNVTAAAEDFLAPVAVAGGPYYGLTDQNIHFDGSRSYGINASIVYYVWSFGDGSYEYNETSFHVYEHAGTYSVILTITDSHNLISVDTTVATIELDANHNNVSDALDEAIGTDITQADLYRCSIDGVMCYLVDTNHDGIYDIYYNPGTNIKTVMVQQNGKLLIDVNGDGRWDYLYDPAYGTFSPFKESGLLGGFPWMYVGIIVIVLVVVSMVLLYLRKNCYI